MEYRTLGKNLTVSAVDMGYTFFDTAEVYGTLENPHDNEELAGMALKPYRNRILLANKSGIHFDMESSEVNTPLLPDSRPEVIRASLEASLKRLNTDHIDLYYQHRPDPDIPIEEVAGVMAELIDEDILDENGLIDVEKLQPISFDPVHNDYRKLGGKAGNAFQDGNAFK